MEKRHTKWPFQGATLETPGSNYEIKRQTRWPAWKVDQQSKSLTRAPEHEETFKPCKDTISESHVNDASLKNVLLAKPSEPAEQGDRKLSALYEPFLELDLGDTRAIVAYRKNSDRRLVAIATILIQEDIENTLKLLVAKRPEHVVEIHEIFPLTNMLYIVSEHMEVSLSQMLCTPLELSEEQIATICKQILLGINALHSIGIIHGGINPSNILFSWDGTAKLANFSSSRISHAYSNIESDIHSSGLVTLQMMDKDSIVVANLRNCQPQLSNPEQWSSIARDFLAKTSEIPGQKLVQHQFLEKSISRLSLGAHIELGIRKVSNDARMPSRSFLDIVDHC